MTSDFSGYDKLVKEIFFLGREGIRKKTLIDKLSLSKQQVRNIAADLVSRYLLRYHEVLIVYDYSKVNLNIMVACKVTRENNIGCVLIVGNAAWYLAFYCKKYILKDARK